MDTVCSMAILLPFIFIHITRYVIIGIEGFNFYHCRTETEIAQPLYTRFIETSYRFITANNRVTEPISIFRESEAIWPTAEQLGFNDSQYEAFKMALTKEFVVIQGKNIANINKLKFFERLILTCQS